MVMALSTSERRSGATPFSRDHGLIHTHGNGSSMKAEMEAADRRSKAELDAAKTQHEAEMENLDRRSTAEIAATRERDSRNWQRDTLVRIGTDVVQSAVDAVGELAKFAHAGKPVGREKLDPYINAARRITAHAESLELLGAGEAAALCRVLEDALTEDDLWNTAFELNRSLGRDRESPQAREADMEYDQVFISPKSRELTSRFRGLTSNITRARTQFNDAVKRELGRLNLGDPSSPPSSVP